MKLRHQGLYEIQQAVWWQSKNWMLIRWIIICCGILCCSLKCQTVLFFSPENTDSTEMVIQEIICSSPPFKKKQGTELIFFWKLQVSLKLNISISKSFRFSPLHEDSSQYATIVNKLQRNYSVWFKKFIKTYILVLILHIANPHYSWPQYMQPCLYARDCLVACPHFRSSIIMRKTAPGTFSSKEISQTSRKHFSCIL